MCIAVASECYTAPCISMTAAISMITASTDDHSAMSNYFMTPCLCGNQSCRGENEVCSASEVCVPAPCTVSDGARASVFYPCTCGSETCGDHNQRYICDASQDSCFQFPQTMTMSR